MKFNADLIIREKKTGKKKDGSSWYMLKVCQENTSNLTSFVSKDLYDALDEGFTYVLNCELKYDFNTKSLYFNILKEAV